MSEGSFIIIGVGMAKLKVCLIGANLKTVALEDSEFVFD